MRGGAIALFAWAGMLAVLAIIHAIWTHGGGIQVYEWGFALAVVFGWGVGAVALDRRALRRGAPPADDEGLEVVPDLSYGAMLLGAAIGLTVFGQAFGNALTYIGFGAMVLAFGRLVAETRAIERAYRRAIRHSPNTAGER
jgi:hypothetical protein